MEEFNSKISDYPNNALVSKMKQITISIDSNTRKLKSVSSDDIKAIAKITHKIRALQSRYTILENELKRRKRLLNKHQR